MVHLSDLHIHGPEDGVVDRLRTVSSCVEGVALECEAVVVVLSGDISYSGEARQFECAQDSFERIAEELRARTAKSVRWVVVPGNHDGTFTASNQLRLMAIDGVLRTDESKIDDSIVRTAVEPQQHFFAFASRLRRGSQKPIFEDQLLTIQEQQVGAKVVAFWEFNASWMSRVPERQGELVFPVSRYAEHLRRPADFRVAVLHHPINWYAQQTYHPLRQLLTKNFSMVLTGHEHVQNEHIQRALDRERECLFIEAGTLGPHSAHDASEFAVIGFDVDTGAFDEHRFRFDDEAAKFVEDRARRRSLTVLASTYPTTRRNRGFS